MAVTDDVLVIGGGIAGMTAALSCAHEGATVRLVSHKRSTLRQASGLIDVLGYTPEGDGPLACPLDAIDSLPTGHPYERIGRAAVTNALSLFDDLTGDAYRGEHTDRNALVPTHGGTIKPTARYPAGTGAGLASDERDTLLVGFETVTDFDAPMAASHLEATVPFGVSGMTIRFPGKFRADATRTRLARALDADERRDDARAGVRTALADRVRAHLEGAKRVGFPALLGLNRPEAVRQALEADLGVSVFEVPMGPPSLPGMRLERLFRGSLADHGVRWTEGDPVVDFEADRESITRVFVDREGRTVPFEADAYVLATGGLVGKGIGSDRATVSERVFDCYVPYPTNRTAWYDDDAFGDHAFARFGVVVDENCRPLDSRDDPEFDNLFAAGSVLGGHDFAAEKSGSGVSLATGFVAGKRAAEAAADGGGLP